MTRSIAVASGLAIAAAACAGSTEPPPDAPPSHRYETYPGTFVPPYHYPHPVTGES